MPSRADQLGGLVREVWSDCFLLSNYDLRGGCVWTGRCLYSEWGFQRSGHIFGCADLRWSVGRSSYDGCSFFFFHWFCGLVFFGGAWLGFSFFFFFLFLMLVETCVVVWDGR